MRKFIILAIALVALAIPAAALAAISSSTAASCTPTNFRGLTAAQIGGNVTGNLDASGCDIGVYYGPGTTGSVNRATIKNALWFGVVNHDGIVEVKNSTISQIGDTPFNGVQRGFGILFTTEETPGETTTTGATSGLISGNVVSQYQKNGIVVRGIGASAQIQKNTVTGRGLLGDIAQNGIQASFGGKAIVKGNTVSGHYYTPSDPTRPDNDACGLLFYDAVSDAERNNTLSGNEVNVCVVHNS